MRDQSYDVGTGRKVAPLRRRRDHQSRVQRRSIAPGWQGLAVRVGIALAVARLRVRTAAAAHPLVARLDRPGLLAGRVVEVRLDRRLRAAETVGDLRNRKTLGVAEMTREGDRTAPLDDPTRVRRV